MTRPTGRPDELPLDAIRGGIVVGIGIATGVGGFILGILFFGAWYLAGRKRYQEMPPRVLHRDSRYKCAACAHDSSLGWALESNLLEGRTDDSILFSLRALAELVKVHAGVYYHDGPVGIELETLTTALARLGMDEADAADLEKLALDAATRQLAIRHVVSSSIFGGLDPRSLARFPLLPPPAVAFLRSAGQDWSCKKTSPEVSLALLAWNRLSSFLLHPRRRDKTPLSPVDNKKRPEIRALVKALDGFLQHFAMEAHSDRRLEHLEEIVHEASRLGYSLFSHPCAWAFELGVRSLEKEVLVAPGLQRCSGYDGGLLQNPLWVAQPETVTLEEVLEAEGGSRG